MSREDIALASHDAVVIAQKVVSKAEGRRVSLKDVVPSVRAVDLAAKARKDPRVVELILSESGEVLRTVPDVIIVRHRLGLVMANAGIDRSNLGPPDDQEAVLLLPRDPDASAAKIRAGLASKLGTAPAVVISDSFGRPWRLGTTNVAIGVAGLPCVVDRRGEKDRYGRELETTEVALADAVASAAGLAMGEAAEGCPVVHIRGMKWDAPEQTAASLTRPLDEDLFR